MSIIGFNFTKINCERKAVIAGNVTINHTAAVTNVELDEVRLGTVQQKILRLVFSFKYSYQPELAIIEFEGDVLWLDNPESIQVSYDTWKKDKKLPEPVMGQIMYHIVSRCNIQALFLSRELTLPPPIPIMPQATPVSTNQEATNKKQEV